MRDTVALILIIALSLTACVDRKPSNPVPNEPPDTHLFLVFGDSLGVSDSTALPDTSASMLVLHWYGDDPDGEIIGYEWAWDDTVSLLGYDVDSTWWLGDSAYTEEIETPDSITLDSTALGPWTFTEQVRDTFYVKIREAFNYFTFYVRALDNDSVADPSPSIMTFPIINSPPSVQLPVAFINDYATVHSITLGYHTFSWTGSDPDGDETISGYQLALTDSSFHWDPDTTINDTIRFAGLDWSISLDSLTFSYTFSGLQPGCYRMFLRSYDITGSFSRVKYYPDTAGVWEVIASQGNILYVDDNSYYTAADTMFIHTLNDLGMPYTSLSFINGAFYYTQDFQASLGDFDILIYNAGYSRHFRETSSAISGFINSGGHVMVNTQYSATDTTIYSFMPIDTINGIYDNAIQRPIRFIHPDSTDILEGYPDTLQTNQPLSFAFGFKPHAPAGMSGGCKVLYTINATMGDPGSVGDTVAVRFPYEPGADVQPPAKVILFSFPVFDCNVNNSFYQLLSHILLNEFVDE